MTKLDRHARSIPAALRAELLHLGAECHYCGSWRGLVVEHMLPVAQGGSSKPDNLVAACWRCNAEKSDWTPSQWRARRIASGKPWPPPCIDFTGTDAALALPRELRQPFLAAVRASDVQVCDELDRMQDRARDGRDNPPEVDAKLLKDAVAGSVDRVRKARNMAIAELRAVVTTYWAECARFEAMVEDDALNVQVSTWDDLVTRFRNGVASHVAEISGRFLSGDERSELDDLISSFDSAAVHARRVAHAGAEMQSIIKLDYVDHKSAVPDILRRKLARDVATFSQRASLAEQDRLRTLLASVAPGRDTAPLVLF